MKGGWAMLHNILITSAGKRVSLTRYFKETLNRFYPDAKVFTTDMPPPAWHLRDTRATDASKCRE